MKKKKKDYTALGWILYAVFFFAAAFFIYNKVAERNIEIINEMQKGRNLEEVSQDILHKTDINQEEYRFKYSFIINTQGYIKRLTLKIPIPKDIEGKQTITNLSLSHKPVDIIEDKVNKIAEFTFTNLNNEKISVSIQGNALLQSYDLKTARLLNQKIESEQDLSKYLKPEPYIESNDPMIKRTANKIKGSSQEDTIQKIYEYTQNALTYVQIAGISGAKRALNEKKGKCSEYSAVMIALCRAKGIPARIVTGNIAREKNSKHNWVEVYFDKYGWVTFDPTVMATVVNIYNNGKLVRQEKRLEPFNASAKYIISARNQFSPYFVSYSVADNRNGRAMVQEVIEINKIK